MEKIAGGARELSDQIMEKEQQLAYQWKPIEDLPADWESLAQHDLESLASIWRDQAKRLTKLAAWQHFNDRLRREWAIETGIIENLYSIDRGITELLIEKGIEASLIPYGTTDKPVDQIVPVLKDQESALEFVFEFVASKRHLSTSYVKELHQLLTQHQETVRGKDSLGRSVEVPLERGTWKTHPNNPQRLNGHVHEYCPPEHVAAEMDRLIELHHQHAQRGVPPEVESAWLHHRFTQIHPFQDGNGRVARALASLALLRAGWFPLVINRDIRNDYLDALETADHNGLLPLVELFAKNQKNFFIRALSLSEDILYQQDPLGQVISAAADKIKAKEAARRQRMQEQARERSLRLETAALERLQEVSNKLSAELRHVHNFRCRVDRSTDQTDFWFKNQIVEMANKFSYYADTRSYRAWVRLQISEQRQTDLVIAFHSLGVEPLGVIAASAFVEHRDRSEDEIAIEGPYPACKDVFQLSYRDKEDQLLQRFGKWLTEVILLGLEQWRRQL